MFIRMINISQKIYFLYILITILYCSTYKATGFLWKINLCIFKNFIIIIFIKCNHLAKPPSFYGINLKSVVFTDYLFIIYKLSYSWILTTYSTAICIRRKLNLMELLCYSIICKKISCKQLSYSKDILDSLHSLKTS